MERMLRLAEAVKEGPRRCERNEGESNDGGRSRRQRQPQDLRPRANNSFASSTSKAISKPDSQSCRTVESQRHFRPAVVAQSRPSTSVEDVTTAQALDYLFFRKDSSSRSSAQNDPRCRSGTAVRSINNSCCARSSFQT
jgi:hypothetical protein